jgi:SAM-dependent methyltransferase
MINKLWRLLSFNWRYLGTPPWDTGVSPPELLVFLNTTSPGRALDLGCGTGTNLITLVEFGWQAVGIDFAYLSVWQARAKLRNAGYQSQVIQGNVASELPLEDKFNLILDIGCYHSLTGEDRTSYQHNIDKWLVAGGTFLIYAHLNKNPEDQHGIGQRDLHAFSDFLSLQWQRANDEERPNGGGGFPALWAQFIK